MADTLYSPYPTSCEHGYQHRENCPDCTPSKKPTVWPTVIIAVIVIGLLFAARSGLFQTVPKVPVTEREILPTSALISFIPTTTPWPTNTSVPTSTRPAPTITQVIVPSPTVDPEYIRKMNDINAQARDIKNAQDAAELEIAWGWVKLCGVVALMVIGLIVLLIAAITAYIRTLRGDFRERQQNAAHDHRTAQDERGDEGETLTAPDAWLDLIDWKDGKMPYATKLVESMFGGQNEYREFLANMKLAGWAERRPAGWYVTRAFAREVGREILNVQAAGK